MWIDVILPLAISNTYTYYVPEEFQSGITIGIRVEAQIRSKHYTGIVKTISEVQPEYNTRPIISILDSHPIVTSEQILLWTWMASYYCCTIGEVMNVALPSGLKLSSETQICLNPYQLTKRPDKLSRKEYLLYEILEHQKEISVDKLKKLLGVKSVYAFLKSQMQQKSIITREELQQRYKPKYEDYLRATEAVMSEDHIDEIFAQLSRSEKQQNTLLKIVELHEDYDWIPKFKLYKILSIDNTVIKALEKKGFIEVRKKEINRIKLENINKRGLKSLSEAQQKASDNIYKSFENFSVVLLQGVTGSGKTQIYIHHIESIISAGGQVLYMLPEIALTSQMLTRLQHAFGADVIFYHSRMTNHEQVEVWKRILEGHPIVLGARSSLLLPYQNLQLIIVDEEHDSSYKQQDPSPRYNARDVATYLSDLYSAKVILGTATPSLDTLHNKINSKYAYVAISERYGEAILPEIQIVDLSVEQGDKKEQVVFSERLINSIRVRVENGEQVLLFQNRRGFAPTVKCFKCGVAVECPNCDVSLTLHQYTKEMRCHYCGFRSSISTSCFSCGNTDLKKLGFGTERIEDLLSEVFPDFNIRRLDHDTVRSKTSYNEILSQMEVGRIDVLIGTQMVTKGLDFSNITLVGILHADALFTFPDFRAGEKAFQLLTQVSGRAGRSKGKTEVLVQTYDPENWIIKKVLEYDFTGFASKELSERKMFFYPPFSRLIKITIKHKFRSTAKEAARLLGYWLKSVFSKRVLGPAEPGIARINNQYHFDIMMKIEKQKSVISHVKACVLHYKQEIAKKKGLSTVRIIINVDPL